MVHYSINSDIRIYVYLWITLLSGLIVEYLRPVVEAFQEVAGIVAFPLSLFGVFFGLVKLFDKFVWRFPYINGILGIPDLNGEYQVEVNERGKKFTFDGSISQTFTKIHVQLSRQEPKDKSVSAFIDLSNPKTKTLMYSYKDMPTRIETGRREGFQTLILEGKDKLEGYYYSTPLQDGNLSMVRKIID